MTVTPPLHAPDPARAWLDQWFMTAPLESVGVGFTGTQKGMTPPQRLTVGAILRGAWTEVWTNPERRRLHHGCCVGADLEAHQVAIDNMAGRIIAHPAFDVAEAKVAVLPGREWMIEYRDPKQALVRNQAIVNETALLIACPGQAHEVRRSGTWSTVRYARQRDRVLVIVAPDGDVEWEDRTF